jgi:ABC-2 family transporter protein
MTHPYPSRAAQETGDALPGGYVSPIPVRRAHLGDALIAEWTKIRTLRSTLWTLGVLIVLVVGLGVLLAWVVAVASSGPETRTPLILGFVGVQLATLCVITLGVMTVSSEYGTGLIRTTLTACPSRSRVLAAKSIVYFSLTFVIMLVTTLVTGVLQVVVLNARNPSGDEWLRATVGVSAFMGLLGLLSLAVGVLIRHSAGAITVMIGFVLLPLVLALFLYAPSLGGVRDWLLDYSFPSQLSDFYTSAHALSPTGNSSSPHGWDPLWIMLAVTAVVMAGACVLLDRRDA